MEHQEKDQANSLTVIRFKRAVATSVASGFLALGIALAIATVGHPERDQAYEAGLVCIVVAAITFGIAQSRDNQVRAALRDAEIYQRLDEQDQVIQMVLEADSTMLDAIKGSLSLRCR